MKRRILFHSLIFALLYFTAYVFCPITVNGVAPQYLLGAVVAMGLFENEYFGSVYGIIFGLLADFAGGGIFGVNTIIFMTVGYFVGFFAENRLSSNLLVCEGVTLGVVFVKEMLRLCGDCYMNGAPFFGVFVKAVIPETVLTGLVLPVIYFAEKYIGTNRKWRRYNEKIR